MHFVIIHEVFVRFDDQLRSAVNVNDRFDVLFIAIDHDAQLFFDPVTGFAASLDVVSLHRGVDDRACPTAGVTLPDPDPIATLPNREAIRGVVEGTTKMFTDVTET